MKLPSGLKNERPEIRLFSYRRDERIVFSIAIICRDADFGWDNQLIVFQDRVSIVIRHRRLVYDNRDGAGSETFRSSCNRYSNVISPEMPCGSKTNEPSSANCNDPES